MSEEARHMNDTTMPPPPPRRSKGDDDNDNNNNNNIMAPPVSSFKSKTIRSLAATATTTTTTGIPRNKKGLAKGFGLHDWALLTKTAKDLAQRKGAPLRQITRDELRQHCHIWDGWCALKGKVYNIGPYLPYHPGGETIMHKVLGKDASVLFDKYHPWVNIDGLVGTLQIGYLDVESQSSDNDKTGYLQMQQQRQRPSEQKTTIGHHNNNEFTIPAPVVAVTKTKDKNGVSNVLPPANFDDKTNDIDDDDYKEPWET